MLVSMTLCYYSARFIVARMMGYSWSMYNIHEQ